jgi:hypothetical protein
MEKLKNLLSKLPHPVRWVLSMVFGFALLILGLVSSSPLEPSPVSISTLSTSPASTLAL